MGEERLSYYMARFGAILEGDFPAPRRISSDGFDGTAICCAWAPLPGAQLNPLRLRQALAKALPSYMLPSRWMALDELPKNVNGKIDRRRLREMFSGQAVDG
jgi:acyl-CoA synthetase (AMP-forming)/AMP-acid ligase II